MATQTRGSPPSVLNCTTVSDFSSPTELAGPDMATQTRGSPPGVLKLYNCQRCHLPHWSWLVMLASDNQLYPLASLGYHPLTCRNCATTDDGIFDPTVSMSAPGTPISMLVRDASRCLWTRRREQKITTLRWGARGRWGMRLARHISGNQSLTTVGSKIPSSVGMAAL